jgi:hypothetical protein
MEKAGAPAFLRPVALAVARQLSGQLFGQIGAAVLVV